MENLALLLAESQFVETSGAGVDFVITIEARYCEPLGDEEWPKEF